MLKNFNIKGIMIILFVSVFVVTIGFMRTELKTAKNVYMVYLDGKKLGLIDDKDTLYSLIDKEQENIKTDFGVEKVYPPDSLETIEYTTYNTNLKSAEDIYNTIAEKSTFTVKGYTVTIKKDEEDPIYINILNKEDLEQALLDAVKTFIKSDSLEAYINDTQVEVTDTGKTIENVYFDEKITIKENLLPVDEMIITNKVDLTKYLLFGTLEQQEEYIVKEGDTVESVALDNSLSNEELLIANPNLTSVNALLSPGQNLSIGLLSPLFTVVEESEVIEDIDLAYDTIIETDRTKYADEQIVKQEGVKGKNRVKEKVLRKNGDITNLYIIERTKIAEPINKIIVKGTKPTYNFSNIPPAASSTDWGWPTISPYVITSYYGWRWGKLHGGLDISGSGFGSPIYSATEGRVIRTFSGCADKGYYGSPCGGQMGNYVEIETSTGLIVYYAHMKSVLRVSLGDTVTKGQLIGYMGSSGSSTGTHLHFEIRDQSGTKLNPCKAAFAC